MFHKLTEKQIGVFSRKLAELPELGSKAPMGKSMDEYTQIIANDLRSTERQAFTRLTWLNWVSRGCRGLPMPKMSCAFCNS